MNSLRLRLLLLPWILLLSIPSPPARASDAAGPDERRFEFDYEVTIPLEAGQGPVDVFVPIPVANEVQTVEDVVVTSDLEGRIETEARFGNRFWHGSIDRAPEAPIQVKLRARVVRRLHQVEPGATGGTTGDADDPRFLGPNERVFVNHPMLDPILEEVRERAGSDDPAALGRAVYDWVVENVEYKKVGSGWGNGDTYWACTERYGNCTDFHALFISLARSLGIPARFEIGFPVPLDRLEGDIGGYHCWVEFRLPGVGWVPIDASEAFKHPEKRALFYGTHPADRIHFTTGRDLQLGEAHRSAPLNYFVYPHVEVDGELWKGPVERRFRYRELSRAGQTVGAAPAVGAGSASTEGADVPVHLVHLLGDGRPGAADAEPGLE
jgi:transglutaminase-like putative cysteine protease